MTAKEFLKSKNVFHGLGVEEDNVTGNSHKIADLMEEFATKQVEKALSERLSEKKRLFQVLDDLNVEDAENNTSLLKVSETLISVDKVKQGAKIAMGAEEACIWELASDEKLPILILVDKKECQKRMV